MVRDFDTNNDQFTISVELLRLMQWIIEHDQEGLKRLMSRALSRGLNKKLNGAQDAVTEDSEHAHHSIIDFFLLMEALLIETVNENAVKDVLQRNLIPSVNRIDTTACDTDTVRFSLERATSKMQAHPQESPRDLLLKELIKNWKPNKKNRVN
jgi:hypothetical protein